MKRVVLLLTVMAINVAITQTKAENTQYHGFLKYQYEGYFTDWSKFAEATKAAAKGDKTYYQDPHFAGRLPAHLRDVLKRTHVDVNQVIDSLIWVPAEEYYQYGSLQMGALEKDWKRTRFDVLPPWKPRPGEMIGVYPTSVDPVTGELISGIAVISTYCGNLAKGSIYVPPATPVKTQDTTVKAGGNVINITVTNTNTNNNTPAPAGGSGLAGQSTFRYAQQQIPVEDPYYEPQVVQNRPQIVFAPRVTIGTPRGGGGYNNRPQARVNYPRQRQVYTPRPQQRVYNETRVGPPRTRQAATPPRARKYNTSQPSPRIATNYGG